MGQREVSATAMMKNGREAGRCLTTAVINILMTQLSNMNEFARFVK